MHRGGARSDGSLWSQSKPRPGPRAAVVRSSAARVTQDVASPRRLSGVWNVEACHAVHTATRGALGADSRSRLALLVYVALPGMSSRRQLKLRPCSRDLDASAVNSVRAGTEYFVQLFRFWDGHLPIPVLYILSPMIDRRFLISSINHITPTFPLQSNIEYWHNVDVSVGIDWMYSSSRGYPMPRRLSPSPVWRLPRAALSPAAYASRFACIYGILVAPTRLATPQGQVGNKALD